MATDAIRGLLPVGETKTFKVLDVKQIEPLQVAVSIDSDDTRFDDITLAANASQVAALLADRAGKDVSVTLSIAADGAEPDIVSVTVTPTDTTTGTTSDTADQSAGEQTTGEAQAA